MASLCSVCVHMNPVIVFMHFTRQPRSQREKNSPADAAFDHFIQTRTWTVLLALICSWWSRSHCWLCWYCRGKGAPVCYPSPEQNEACGCEDGRSLFTFSTLLWCFCSLSRSVGRATLMNLWIGASRRLSVSLLPSSAMCPADCPQPTPLRKLDAAPARPYLTTPTLTVNTWKEGFS